MISKDVCLTECDVLRSSGKILKLECRKLIGVLFFIIDNRVATKEVILASERRVDFNVALGDVEGLFAGEDRLRRSGKELQEIRSLRRDTVGRNRVVRKGAAIDGIFDGLGEDAGALTVTGHCEAERDAL
jgi:hypothetical protein